jgi:hypothetical protein
LLRAGSEKQAAQNREKLRKNSSGNYKSILKIVRVGDPRPNGGKPRRSGIPCRKLETERAQGLKNSDLPIDAYPTSPYPPLV